MKRPRETVVMRLEHECTGATGSCTDAPGQRGFDSYVARYPNLFWPP